MSVLAPPLAPIVGLREARIIMLGLDGAGKTTILYKLKLGEIVSTIPTIDFNVENVQYKNMSFTIWDVGGQANIRALWLHHFQGTQGLVFVIDSTDSDRTDEAAGMLHEILREPDMGGVAVLVLANKQDLPHALSTTQLADRLRLNTIRQPWFILVASAATGDGLYDGLDWLAENLKKNTA